MSGQESPDGRIAIVGMAGRFPGAGNIDQFWDNLCRGIESVRFFADGELDDWFDQDVRGAPNFVKARPVLDGVDQFDAGFFGMHAREAELTDPQHRIFLECAWQALEDSGYDPAGYEGAIGVFAGCSMNTYFLNNICRNRRALEEFTSTFQVGGYPTLLGTGREFLATRVSYKLDLRGPSLTIQTACSTSLVAVAQACQSLLLYQSDMALAGGVSISFPQHRGYLHQEGGMVSADGHCRPFDEDASGTVFGSGAGVVVLKRLAEAVADGDHVYAVILGSGLSNDGADKVGFTAPSVNGQAAAIEQALAQAGIEPRSVGYVECHGTATPLGDPIEIAALTKVFRQTSDERGYCAIGSVKGNIGHLDAAAGVAGLIKAALMLKHRRLVPSLHFKKPNPHLDLAGSPFFVATGLDEWKQGDWPRRAGVSSLGVGGTNAHAILEEPPRLCRARQAARPEVLVLSARSASALSEMRARLGQQLRDQPEQELADIAFTLQRGRRHFATRCALVCRDHADAAALLGTDNPVRIVHGEAAEDVPPVAFMFPGQGAQYPDMARGLHDRFPVFRRELERCAAILEPLGVDLRDALYGSAESNRGERLARTGTAQPAIFSIEYALAQLWLSWGVQPCALIGHSVGEFVAACLSGVFTLEDALGLVSVRGRLMEGLQAGGMTAVRLPESEIEPLLGAAISLAAINGPSHCVVAGPIGAIAELEARLESAGVSYRRLHTSHAFHSAMMDPVIAPLTEHASRIPLGDPRVPWVSTVTGDWIGAEQAASPAYWARHAREPVRFAAGIRTLMARGPVLLECGPGNTLSSLAMQTGQGRAGKIISSLPDATRPVSDDESILGAAGKLWVNGVELDWDAMADAPRMRVSLPTYPFERRRYWIEPPARDRAEPIDAAAENTAEVSSAADILRKEQPMDACPPSDARPELRSAPAGDDIGRTIASILEEISGTSVADAAPATTFLEMGFDSLLLSQVAQQLQARFKVKVAFRQLLGQLSTIPDLAQFLREHSPVAAAVAAPVAVRGAAAEGGVAPVRRGDAMANEVALPAAAPQIAAGATDGVAALMRAQVEAMSGLIQKQLEALQRIAPPAMDVAATVAVVVPPRPAALPEPEQRPSRFHVYRPVQKPGTDDIAPAQKQHIDRLVQRLTAKTAGSKRMTATYRPVLADPRAAAGFRAEWKELVYPIVGVRSRGSRLWDVDGNEYIDLVNGYGPTAFGHAADFVTAALREQLDKGFATGPQAEFAGEVAALFTEMTGNERMTFCNTGSEAVMAALRVARAVTGRNKVVMFGGAYHGQFDEVLVRRGGKVDGTPRSVPIASGIPASAVENIVVLDYASAAALDWVRENAEDLAAVIVEPVQSRHPDLRPFEFLRALREITEASGTAFIMDEIVTGFRVHPGGMQAITGIRADLATYGKIIGGGMPIGILAGKARFMDALDGGMWNYGDDSVPEVGVTFFAGTFVRHPLTLAAVRAVLLHLKAHGPALQEQVARRAEMLAVALDDLFRRHGMAAKVERYSSFLYFSLHADDPLAGLLFYHLRDRGIHVQDGFPLFLTTAHSEEDIGRVITAFSDSLNEMADAGIVKADAAGESVAARAVALTESQVEIWLSAQMGDEASCAFNESVTLRLNGRLDEAALAAALARVAARHDALRLRFSPTGESMSVGALPAFDVASVDAAGIDGRSADDVLASYIEEDARTPFDLVEGPPVRVRLFRLSAESHALVLTAHHIVCDGWSLNVIINELAAFYASLRGAGEPELPPVLAFTAYAEEQAGRDPAEREAVEAYWLGQFATQAQPIDLPTDRPRLAQRTYAGSTRCHHIGKTLYRAVKSAGARNGGTLFVALLAAFEALMGRLAGVEDLVVAVPTAGQSLVEGRQLAGHCVNFLPIRGGWSADTSFADHLRAVSKQVLDAYEHQECTLGTIVRKLALPRQPNRLPLTEIQFNLERLADKLHAAGLDIEVTPNPKRCVNFDIFWNVIESDDGLRIDCDYNTHLFDAGTIDRWLRYYETLLEAMTVDASRPVVRMPYLPADERERIITAGDATAAEYPRELCVPDLINSWAAQRPYAKAVIFQGQAFSYRAINERANRLAQHLRAAIGPAPARVGVLVDRSVEMLVALLAVWKAGCAYVPLDPFQPAGRIRTSLAEADVAALLTDGSAEVGRLMSGIAVIDIVEEREAIGARPAVQPSPGLSPETAAYVIFTSGSTGSPKGVEVSHRSLVNLLCSMAKTPGLQASDTLFAVTTIGFDIAALELFLPLSVGASVAIAERDDVRDGFRLLAALKESAANVMQATPTTWRMLLEAGFGSWPGFKMLCGGEALSEELAGRLLEGGGSLWNMYGPTETTVWSSCCEIVRGNAAITIGAPIANTQLHILDRYGEPAPIGVTGELLIGGDGVANGYFRRDALTAEKFIADPFGISRRLYRTGDAARRLPDGGIRLLGRLDSQVKLRGFRIELGEIEAVLMRHGGVAAAAVLLREDSPGEPMLAGYIVERPDAPRPQEALRASIADQLPDYMIPSRWVYLSSLPVSANGKLDRDALPAPGEPMVRADTFVPPETPLETSLASIWADVLKLKRVGRTDELFRLGADSIHLFQIAARANRQGLRISARQLLDHRTIAELAAVLEAAPGDSAEASGEKRAAISLREFQRSRQMGLSA